MAKVSSTTRAPRGTKILAKAFFAAADEIPEPQRAGAIKAALAFIRDELKAAREKAATAKAWAKTGKASAPGRKATGIAMAPARAAKKRASLQAKSPAKRARKAAPKTVEPATPVASVETAVPSDT